MAFRALTPSSSSQAMDLSYRCLPASLLMVSLLVLLSVSVCKEQGGELESRLSDSVRRPNQESAHTQVILKNMYLYILNVQLA